MDNEILILLFVVAYFATTIMTLSYSNDFEVTLKKKIVAIAHVAFSAVALMNMEMISPFKEGHYTKIEWLVASFIMVTVAAAAYLLVLKKNK